MNFTKDVDYYNKEKIKKRVNERRIIKRDEINAQKREHYAKNKETILSKQKTQEYKDNANKIRRERRARKKIEKDMQFKFFLYKYWYKKK